MENQNNKPQWLIDAENEINNAANTKFGKMSDKEFRFIEKQSYAAQQVYNQQTGIWAMDSDKKKKAERKGGHITGIKSVENRTGIHGLSAEQRSINASKGGISSGYKTYENGTGIHGLSAEERSANAKKGAHVNAEKRKAITLQNRLTLMSELDNGWITRKDTLEYYFLTEYPKLWNCTSGAFVSNMLDDTTLFETKGNGRNKLYKIIWNQEN